MSYIQDEVRSIIDSKRSEFIVKGWIFRLITLSCALLLVISYLIKHHQKERASSLKFTDKAYPSSKDAGLLIPATRILEN